MLRAQNSGVNLAVGGYAGCVLLWKLGSEENVCNVGRRVERNGSAALDGCHDSNQTVLGGTVVIEAVTLNMIDSLSCVAVPHLSFALVSRLISRSGWFSEHLATA
jgi:hypothetical protein